jgi:hypothetical protein
MSEIARPGWYFVSLVDSKTLWVIKSNIDAVFACGSDEAMEQAGKRNPRRPGQIFGLQKATAYEKSKAVRRSNKRTEDNDKFMELMQRE